MTISFTSLNACRRLKMFTNGQAQKYASRAMCFAYSSVILTRVSGPGGRARAHSGDGGKGWGFKDEVSACAVGISCANAAVAPSVVLPSRTLRRLKMRSFSALIACLPIHRELRL